jgi:hypothetical protein
VSDLDGVKLALVVIGQACIGLFSSDRTEREESAEFFLTSWFRFYLRFIEEKGINLKKAIGVGKMTMVDMAKAVATGRAAEIERYRAAVMDSPLCIYLNTGKPASTKTEFVLAGDGQYFKKAQVARHTWKKRFGETPLQVCLVN